ncbi:MAG: hypothetical protein WAO29_02785 [Candidatus Nanopelagicales bacterium]
MKHFLLQIIAFLYVITAANAATIKKHPPNTYGCSVSLTGEIVSGDSEVIKPLLYETYEISLSDDGRYGETLCLNSPGGDLNEGIKIANYVSEYYTSTVVYSNARCESSCAVIFLASGSPSISPDGTIGLHAPKLILPKGTFTEEDVAKAYDLSVFTIREIMKMPAFPPAGVRYMTSTPSSEMYIPKTFFEMSELGVTLLGFSFAPRQLPVEQQMENACRWAIWQTGGSNYFNNPTNRVMEFVGFKGVSSNVEELAIEAEFSVLDGEESYYPCNVKVGFRKNRVTGSLDYFSASVNVLGQEVSSNYIGIYSPNASYLDIYRLPELSPDQFIAVAKAIEDDVLEKDSENLQTPKCFISSPTSTITNVQNFTNLRRQAGLNGQVMVQVPLGASVSVVNPGNFLRTDRCASICNGTNQNAIKQCIDNNDVWIEVQHNGRRGFLSRKFLE